MSERRRLKTIFSILSGNGFPLNEQGKDEGKYPFMKNSDINGEGIYVNTAVNYVDNEQLAKLKLNVIPTGSILMGKIGEALRKNHRKINACPCIVDNNMQALAPKIPVNEKFVYFLLTTIDMDWFTVEGAIPSINNRALGNYSVWFPPFSTQTAIVAYLDKQVAIIDGQIAKNKTAIELLTEYRASVITHKIWDNTYLLERLRFHTSVRNEKGQYNENFIGLENIESYTGKYVETETLPSEEEAKIFKKGDLLVNRLRPYLTKSLLASKDGTCTGELVVIQKFSGYMKWLLYLTLSHKYINQVESSVFGAKMPRANWDFIKNIQIPIVPITGQQEIVAYLDKHCEQVDRIIAYRKAIIEKLEEYKKSLIYEAVTGKKEIK